MNVDNPTRSRDDLLEGGLRGKSDLAATLSSGKLQYILALVFGLVAPLLFSLTQMGQNVSHLNLANQTYLSCIIAISIGFIVFRKMAAMPGLKELSSILPAFCLSYGLVAALYFGLRLDISRIGFVLSISAVCSVLLALQYSVSQLHRPIIGVIMGGRAETLIKQKQIKWRPLHSIEDAKKRPNLAIAVDLRSDTLSPEWESYIAEEVIQGRNIFNAKQLNESITGQVQLENLSENYIGMLSPDVLYASTKRYFDILISVIGLIVLAPLMALTAVLIRKNSPGPAIFKQERMGFQGRPFVVYKFRSMRNLTEEEIQKARENKALDMTGENDPRITKFGRFLRKTRIDETPQLLNVLKGEMSLIGPRPETMNLSNWYEKEIPFYRYRHIVRPGITGWAQINQGHVTSVEDVREKMKYDLYYIKHFSIWLDFVILIKTIKIVFTHKGAK